MDGPFRGVARRPARVLVTRVATTAAFALVVAACGSVAGSATPSPSTGSPAPSVTAPVAASTPVTTPPPVAASAPIVPSPGSTDAAVPPLAAVTIDRSLALLLPSTVSGIDVVPATATEEAAMTSARFGDSASGFAAVEAISSPDADLAIASMIRLRPDVSPATFYADWRPGYDDAACRPAGGVSTRETQQVGGRTVDVTHCAQGATLYHVWLGGERVLLSVLDVGPSSLGRALVVGAKDPAP